MKWIKVKDLLPEEDQAVIYWFECISVSRGKFTMTKDGPCFYGKGGWLTDDVTHWMPDDGRTERPDPPKE